MIPVELKMIHEHIITDVKNITQFLTLEKNWPNGQVTRNCWVTSRFFRIVTDKTSLNV